MGGKVVFSFNSKTPITFLTPPSLQAKSMSYVVIKLIDLEILQRKQLSMLYVSEE